MEEYIEKQVSQEKSEAQEQVQQEPQQNQKDTMHQITRQAVRRAKTQGIKLPTSLKAAKGFLSDIAKTMMKHKFATGLGALVLTKGNITATALLMCAAVFLNKKAQVDAVQAEEQEKEADYIQAMQDGVIMMGGDANSAMMLATAWKMSNPHEREHLSQVFEAARQKWSSQQMDNITDVFRQYDSPSEVETMNMINEPVADRLSEAEIMKTMEGELVSRGYDADTARGFADDWKNASPEFKISQMGSFQGTRGEALASIQDRGIGDQFDIRDEDNIVKSIQKYWEDSGLVNSGMIERFSDKWKKAPVEEKILLMAMTPTTQEQAFAIMRGEDFGKQAEPGAKNSVEAKHGLKNDVINKAYSVDPSDDSVHMRGHFDQLAPRKKQEEAGVPDLVSPQQCVDVQSLKTAASL